MKTLRIRTLGILVSVLLAVSAAVVIGSSFVIGGGVKDIGQTWEDFDQGPAKKVLLLRNLYNAIGFGGMIHEFKDYVLRRERWTIPRVRAKLRETAVTLAAYADLGVNDRERQALQTIGGQLEKYANALFEAEKMSAGEKLAGQIDLEVKVDRGPTLEALQVLVEEYDKARTRSSAAVSGAVKDVAATSTGTTVVVAVLLIALVLTMVWFSVVRLGRPLNRMTACMNALSKGDLATEVCELERGDELGEMAKAVQVFKGNALKVKSMTNEQEALSRRNQRKLQSEILALTSAMEEEVQGVISVVMQEAESLQDVAGHLESAVGEVEHASKGAASASEAASGNVHAVAEAAESLSAKVSEINNQVAASRDVASGAIEEAKRANDMVGGLSEAAGKIGEVVSLITDIAEQTNLLALNATIEAARAGEAGKGFAVVAAEVKNLANQTAKATEEIGAQISEVQNATNGAVDAIQSIGKTIERIDQATATIAEAVEEQSKVTHAIADNARQAADGTKESSDHIGEVSRTTVETGKRSQDVKSSASTVRERIQQMRESVSQIIATSSDQRKAQRHTVNVASRVTFRGETYSCLLHDVALAGAAIIDRRLDGSKGEQIELEVPDLGRLTGSIIAVTEQSTHVGLDLDDELTTALEAFIQARSGGRSPEATKQAAE